MKKLLANDKFRENASQTPYVDFLSPWKAEHYFWCPVATGLDIGEMDIMA